MKETIERIDQVFSTALNYLSSFLVAFLSITGFMFGSLALIILMVERGGDISIILFSFKIISIFLVTGLFLIIIRIYFWLIKKYLLPRAEKNKAKRLKEFEEIMRSIIRKELKNKGRKK